MRLSLLLGLGVLALCVFAQVSSANVHFDEEDEYGVDTYDGDMLVQELDDLASEMSVYTPEPLDDDDVLVDLGKIGKKKKKKPKKKKKKKGKKGDDDDEMEKKIQQAKNEAEVKKRVEKKIKERVEAAKVAKELEKLTKGKNDEQRGENREKAKEAERKAAAEKKEKEKAEKKLKAVEARLNKALKTEGNNTASVSPIKTKKPKGPATKSLPKKAKGPKPAPRGRALENEVLDPLEKVGKHAIAWGYSPKNGPARWGDIATDWEACSKGRTQSPVNLLNAKRQAKLPPLELRYAASNANAINTGHTVHVVFGYGSTMKFRGTSYELKSINFHARAEHQVKGVDFPLEIQFVHKTASSGDKDDSKVAILSLLFVQGNRNKALHQLLTDFPEVKGQRKSISGKFNPGDLLPDEDSRQYYTYEGSTTSPPCVEGVQWVVLRHYAEANEEQLGHLAELFHNNRRPVQPVGHRRVLHQSV